MPGPSENPNKKAEFEPPKPAVMSEQPSNKRTVYVLTRGQYSDFGIVGIFSSNEKAKEVAERLSEDDIFGPIHEPEEWEVDAGHEELMKGESFWEVSMYLDGQVRLTHNKGTPNACDFEDINEVFTTVDSLSIKVMAKDEKTAIKIANEKRAQFKEARNL